MNDEDKVAIAQSRYLFDKIDYPEDIVEKEFNKGIAELIKNAQDEVIKDMTEHFSKELIKIHKEDTIEKIKYEIHEAVMKEISEIFDSVIDWLEGKGDCPFK